MMASKAVRKHRSRSWGLYPTAVTAITAMAGLLYLDGELGPVSFTLRRAAALTVLAVIAATRWMPMRPVAAPETSDVGGEVPSSEDRSDGAPHSRGPGQRSSLAGDLRWRIARWAAVLAALAIMLRAPSVPVMLTGFVIALAAIEIGAGPESSRARLAAGLIPACLS
jgi:hypothetical protein